MDARRRRRGAAPMQKGVGGVHARSTTIQAQASSIDDGIAYMRDDLMRELENIDGYVGISLLIDRESGRCIITTAWETEDAMRASADKAKQLRSQAAGRFGGDTEKVEEWEIGVLHRDHQSRDGACVRTTWIKIPRDQADRSIEFYKDSVLPALEGLEGFCSSSFLMDRSSGRAVSSTTFDSRDAMDRNREQAKELRNTRTREMGADVLDVGEFELALAHLRVPELA
jgi:heme-degrading monooxygenase HmoA